MYPAWATTYSSMAWAQSQWPDVIVTKDDHGEWSRQEAAEGKNRKSTPPSFSSLVIAAPLFSLAAVTISVITTTTVVIVGHCHHCHRCLRRQCHCHHRCYRYHRYPRCHRCCLCRVAAATTASASVTTTTATTTTAGCDGSCGGGGYAVLSLVLMLEGSGWQQRQL